ncbi:endopeptidase La [Acidaminobacter hydrogenoformans]|uniref:Lon protease n=1 Tax=Acidaminobacter hydrogenoformans DSM 2784 TaxID=1120920 RepID=A0A1G5RXZ4_9FIRM|nr:endopeptidase La [Acidaminobacter hydrogenoformans]SCZ78913.1 ATP-dependent Lon protease [Acidaminobacter hydrogenoformans DSM 2784]
METNDKILSMPLIPLRGLSVFPYMVLHFDVGREKSIKALEEAMIYDQKIFLTTQRDIDVDLPSTEDFYEIGTICKIKQMLKLPGDAIRVLVEGVSRGKVEGIIFEEPYFKARIMKIEEDTTRDRETEALIRSCLTAFEKYIAVSNRVSPEVMLSMTTIEEPGRFADVLASNMVLKTEQKQEILEAVEPKKRLTAIYSILLSEIEIMEVEKQINEKVRKQINKMQKEYYLREQMKAIREELGEDFDPDDEIEELYKKLDKLKLDKKVADKVGKEIERLARMSPASAESTVVRSYVNWILDLPWNKKTKDTLDISKARAILDEDHYGLKSVKERVLEYLAIRELTKSLKGPIICLVGPPGVGKTSIAKSIARSLNRKFVRMSLGGVRDEAEIRGHRRTYIGAIPGRIINGIKEAGTKNPVFLFDEIDKLTSDFRGDPASALLEVLDPEQNKDFTDHYLEVPFDLSSVMFVTTANSLGTIPRPLLDRMEIIEVSGYTEYEKLNIAKKYLVPKQLKAHGLTEDNLSLSDDTLSAIISYYTRESGVRELERQIATVCRKVATRIVEEKVTTVRVNRSNLDKFLGVKKHHYDEIQKEHQIGIATGLAWTPVGGETLSIEVSIMKGKGNLVLTGQMGDVMKESARAGLSYLRSISEKYEIADDFHEKMDIHIHIPEGAIPKDGPSAGITMATAVLSAITGIPVRNDLAMTGEITLRGRVLPIGGLKEKSLAASRAGVKTVLFPKENVKDLEEIPSTVRSKMKFIPVESMDEVLEHALVKEAIK